MEDIILRDNERRNQLAKIYENLLAACKDGDFPQCIKHDLQADDTDAFKNYEDTLSSNLKKLKEEECPIVVTGETRAGKSTLLNLLVGCDILPSSPLKRTRAVCRLRPGNTKKLEMIWQNNTIKTEHLQEDAEIKQSLKTLFSSKETPMESGDGFPTTWTQLKSVDIFLSSPVLQGHVIFVDTPGYGDDEDTNQDLFNYLPDAIACIYVLNTPNAGGIQADRLPKIWEYQSREHEKLGKPFRSNLTIFVCNKWDQVDEDEQEEVLTHIKSKVREYWPGFIEDNLFTISAKEELNCIKKGKQHSPKFSKLLEKLTELMPDCLEEKIDRHFRYIDSLSEEMQGHLNNTIKTLQCTLKKDQESQIELNSMLEQIEERTTLRQHLINFVLDEYVRLAENQRDHLSCDDVKTKITQQCVAKDFSHFTSFDQINEECVTILHHDIGNEERTWCNANSVNNRWRHIRERILQTTEDISRSKSLAAKITEYFGKSECIGELEEIDRNDVDDQGAIRRDDNEEQSGTGHERNDVFSTGEKIGLVVTSPLLVPVALGASVLAAPFGAGLWVHEKLENRKNIQNFNNNKDGYISACCNKILDPINGNYTKDNIYEHFEKVYIREIFNNLDGDIKYAQQSIGQDLKKLMNSITETSTELRKVELSQDKLSQIRTEIYKTDVQGPVAGSRETIEDSFRK